MEEEAKKDDKRRGSYEGDVDGKPKSKRAKSKGEYSDDEDSRAKKAPKFGGNGSSKFSSKGGSSSKSGGSRPGGPKAGFDKSKYR